MKLHRIRCQYPLKITSSLKEHMFKVPSTVIAMLFRSADQIVTIVLDRVQWL